MAMGNNYLEVKTHLWSDANITAKEVTNGE